MNKMSEAYKTVYVGDTAEIVEKKSRFIANLEHVESEEEALAYIETIRKKYWDARHNCYAYCIGKKQELKRCSDDGEPSQTAGKPMLDVLTGCRSLRHCCCCHALFWRYSFGNGRPGARLYGGGKGWC